MRSIGFDQLDKAALRRWQEDGGDNSRQLQRLLELLPLAVEQELTPRQREILDMRFRRGMRPSEIAEELGISRSAVSRSMSRSVDKLFHALRYSL